jgi:hypothetical protein
MMGHSTKWAEIYGVIEAVQDYDSDKPTSAASLLDKVREIITIAKKHRGPAKMILALEPERGSALVGVIHEIEKYDLTKSRALRQAEGLD